MQISFLAWPPQRLIREAVLVHNLRHPSEQLDMDKTPWERIVPVLFAFIRHELTDYDAALYASTKGERDSVERGRLIAEISEKARRTWGWLKIDPRPSFAAKNGSRATELEYDRVARKLADCRTILHHAENVWRDTRDPQRRAELKEFLAELRADIENYSIPFKLKKDKQLVQGHSRQTRAGTDYDFFGVTYPPSYLAHVPGVRCPKCQKILLVTKSPVRMGQGRRRYVYSCHCLCVAVDVRNLFLSAERWRESLADHGLTLEEAPSPSSP